MVPDIDLQLQSVIKALTDCVAPALDRESKVAVEQLHLAIATLKIVRARVPLARRYARAQLTDAHDLAHAVRGAARTDSTLSFAAIDDAIAAVAPILDDPDADTHDIEGAEASVTAATVALIAAAKTSPATDAITKVVLHASRQSIERGRAWCLPAGFEPRPETIQAIELLV